MQEPTPATVAGQAAALQPDEFRAWLEARQQAVAKILDTVTSVVTENALEPLVGARIASCVVGSAFGYEEFHPRGDSPTAEQMIDVDFLRGIREQALAEAR